MRTPIGIGLIGCGTWGSVHARVYHSSPAVRFVAASDADEGRARDFVRRFGAESAYSDWADLLANPAIDGVAIATPDFTHTEIVRAALRAGRHVLVEKPLATTSAECEEMLAERDAAGVTLMVDFHNRWNVPLLQVRRQVEDGRMGDIQMMNLRLNDTLFVPTQMLSWADRSSPAHFLGSHLVDVVRWISAAEVVRVYAVRRSRVLSGRGIETPDFYQSILEMSNGSTAFLETCWILNERAPSVFDFKAEFVGSKGTAYVNTSDFRAVESYTEDAASLPDVLGVTEVHGRLGGFCVAAIEHFIQCLVDGTEPLVRGEDGLAAARVVEAIEFSATSGKAVDL